MYELYSLRQKRKNGQLPDVYFYDEIPKKLKVQIVQIVRDTVGMHEGYSTLSLSQQVYRHINKTLCKEYGVMSLGKSNKTDFYQVFEYFLEDGELEKDLDIIDLTFRYIEVFVGKKQYNFTYDMRTPQTAEDAIKELNYRLKLAGVGYEFISGEIVRIDSQLVHNEVVKPALLLLQGDTVFEGAQQEFLSAHSHYRHGRYKEALVDCNKSFESLMKGICTKHGWEFDERDTAKKLISKCIANDLIPKYMQAQFGQFQALLESGVPTVRNKEAGHGQGESISDVPVELASYTLHLTATNIVFLAECSKKML